MVSAYVIFFTTSYELSFYTQNRGNQADVVEVDFSRALSENVGHPLPPARASYLHYATSIFLELRPCQWIIFHDFSFLNNESLVAVLMGDNDSRVLSELSCVAGRGSSTRPAQSLIPPSRANTQSTP